jgi:hypothetical protein
MDSPSFSATIILQRGARLLAQIFIVFALLTSTSQVLASETEKAHLSEPSITINKVLDYQQDKKLLIDSESTFNLPETISEAIRHEVPLSFKIQIELLETSKILGFNVQRKRKSVEFHNELYASGVNRLYVLFNTRNHKVQTFKNLDEALSTLSTLEDFPIASLSELHPGQRYTLRMRIKLDIWKLPAPVLIEALLTDKWLLDSQWYETTLKTPLSWQ